MGKILCRQIDFLLLYNIVASDGSIFQFHNSMKQTNIYGTIFWDNGV